MTPTLANFIGENFTVVTHMETNDKYQSGFDATIWRDRQGNIYVSMQGTTGIGDITTDIGDLIANGTARAQIVDMVNWWLQHSTLEGESWAPQFDLDENERLVASESVPGTGLLVDAVRISVNGHSLGGHLSTAFSRLFGKQCGYIDHTYTYNSGGFTWLGNTFFEQFERLLENAGWPEMGRFPREEEQSNFFAEHGINVTANDLINDQYGQRVPLFNEEVVGLPNHYMYKLTDTLALGHLMGELDSSFDIAAMNALFNASSNQPDASLEFAIDTLGALFIGDVYISACVGDEGGSTAARMHYYENLQQLSSVLFVDPNGLLRTPRSEYQNLQIVEVESLANAATSNDPNGYAYRYALLNLNTFAVVGDAGLYSQYNQYGELEAENFSWQYLKDRAEMLQWKQQFNMLDVGYEEYLSADIEGNYTYTDFATGMNGQPLRLNIDGEGFVIPYNQIKFGSDGDDAGSSIDGLDPDSLISGGGLDHLYGGAGNDTIRGKGGRDYLEGNADNDTLYGDGDTDYLYGGTGNDHLHGGTGTDFLYGGADHDTYYYNAGDGNDYIDDISGSNTLTIDGHSVAQLSRVPGATNLYRDEFGNEYLLAGDSLIISVGEDSAAGTITVSQFDLDNNHFGISVTETEELPETTSTVAGSEEIIGTDEADRITGSGEEDVIWAVSGNDVIDARDAMDRVFGGAGNDTMIGGRGSDVLHGGDDRDVLFAGTQEDSIDESGGHPSAFERDILGGDAGDDTLIGSAGQNLMAGGLGADILIAGAGDDIVFGDSDLYATAAEWSVRHGSFGLDIEGQVGLIEHEGEGGNDIILAGPGNDHVLAEHGDDLVYGAAGEDYLQGGLGDDTLYGGEQDDIVFGQEGHDELSGGSGNDALYGDALHIDPAAAGDDLLFGDDGDDLLVGAGGADTLYGGAGDDTLSGDAIEVADALQRNDFLYGEAGSDTLVGGGGDDHLDGGADDDLLFGDALDVAPEHHGHDTLEGGEGNDRLSGQGGDDRLSGGAGEDMLWGGEGDDELAGGSENDELVGEAGDDILYGDAGDDYLFGDAQDTAVAEQGNDVIDGGAGNDYVRGHGGDDRIFGGAGDDELHGEDGNDYLSGGEGEDLIVAGRGDDVVNGGAGRDTFFYRVGDGALTIEDSEAGNTLYLSGLMPGGYTQSFSLGLGSLMIRVGDDPEDRIHIARFDPDDVFASPVIDRFEFADGTALSFEQVIARGFDLDGTEQVDELRGTSANDRLQGWQGDDMIVAGAGDDILDGGAGDDLMEGGAGDDIYHVEQVGDRTIELVDQGIDTVLTALDQYHLGDHLEHLELRGSALSGHGNALDNHLTGNALDNALFGHAGADALFGGAGNDMLDGGTGADLMQGGAGADVYVVDHLDDRTIEADQGGDDRVMSTLSHTLSDHLEALELLGSANIDGIGNGAGNTLIGNDGDNRLSGGAGADLLIGQAGADTLDGDAGADRMQGGSGDDTYLVDQQDDLIIEAEDQGHDVVHSEVDYTLGDHVEQLILVGDAHLSATGNMLDNILTGNDRNNVLDGGEGDDWLIGGGGDDTYVVDSAQDRILELADAGIDEVRSSVSHTLVDQVENLSLTGSANLDGTGNPLANRLQGNAADNVLSGEGGNDLIQAGAGADLLFGGTGHDRLYGNGGADTLYGGEGSDELDGGAGGDWMSGGLGHDIYHVDDVADVILEQPGEGNDLVRSTVSHTLSGGVERLDLQGLADIDGTGNEEANEITGNGGNNVLHGGAGDDRLDGQFGNDTLIGGMGQDTYIVNNLGDSVLEQVGQGFDTVISRVDFTLPDQVEMLHLTGAAALGIGNADHNWLLGNEADNALYGLDRNDFLDGGAGNDWLYGGNGDDLLFGNRSNGQSGGGDGDDFDGGDGIDESVGSDDPSGRFSHFSGDTIDTGSTGAGLVHALVMIEPTDPGDDDYLDGGAGNDSLDGGIGQDILYGGDGTDILAGGTGDDLLDGGKGIDHMEGGGGDDVYHVDGYMQVVFVPDLGKQSADWRGSTEGQDNGEDTQAPGDDRHDNDGSGSAPGVPVRQSAVSFLHQLAFDIYTASIDRLAPPGSPFPSMAPKEGVAALLLARATCVKPPQGHYEARWFTDIVFEQADAGYDHVYSMATFHLDDHIEKLTLLGAEDLDGFGNAQDNQLIGNSAGNLLDGGDGDDLLQGDAGDDTLSGGRGRDTLIGGEGDDTYLIFRDHGVDVIQDQSGQTTVQFGDQIGADQIVIHTVELDGVPVAQVRLLDVLGSELDQGFDVELNGDGLPAMVFMFADGTVRPIDAFTSTTPAAQSMRSGVDCFRPDAALAGNALNSTDIWNAVDDPRFLSILNPQNSLRIDNPDLQAETLQSPNAEGNAAEATWVRQLVDATAAFAPTSFGALEPSAEQRQQIGLLIASSWQAHSHNQAA
jgi:Ca2+-binding RTX toxin-like protein